MILEFTDGLFVVRFEGRPVKEEIEKIKTTMLPILEHINEFQIHVQEMKIPNPVILCNFLKFLNSLKGRFVGKSTKIVGASKGQKRILNGIFKIFPKARVDLV